MKVISFYTILSAVTLSTLARPASAYLRSPSNPKETDQDLAEDQTSIIKGEPSLPDDSFLENRDLTISDFCWKDAYGRGVGTIPTECPGRDKIGLLCYSKCPSGYSRFGFDCHQNCPAGFRDDGLFCRLAEYGRGAGYPWKFGDALNDSGMMARCQRDHGQGNCEKWGAMAYLKCKAGYSPFGCCICRPTPPNCAALGMNGAIDLSCAKKLKIGDPIPMSCGGSRPVKDAGLCYPRCQDKFNGVGPVCWGQPPEDWVDCGFGAAENTAACALAITDQILSVGDVALFIASLGTSSPANIAKGSARYAQLLSKWQKLINKLGDIKDSVPYEVFQKIRDAHSFLSPDGDIQSLLSDLEAVLEPEDIVRLSATILSVFDPTGISGLVSAYTFPMCQVITNEPTSAPVASPVDAPAGAPSGGGGTTTEEDECKCSWWNFFCRMQNIGACF